MVNYIEIAAGSCSMTLGPVTLPTPLNVLVSRALSLCEHILPYCDTFYPFAAIHEKGKVGCLFSHDTKNYFSADELIEQLQWRIIDTTTESHSYSILVYAATAKTQKHTTIDAIAISTGSPDDNELLLLYPYYRVGDKIVVAPPINTMPE